MNKKKTILFFIIPIIIGFITGKVAYFFDQEIIIRLLITLSDNILVVLKFIIPFLVLCLVMTSICEIKGGKVKKIKTIGSLFRIILITLIPLTIVITLISQIIVPILSFDIINSDSPWVFPLFKLSIEPLFSTFSGIVLGVIIGVFIKENNILYKIAKEIQNIIYSFFKYVLKPIMPLWILASFALTSYSGSGIAFFMTDFLLSILILTFQFSWLLIMYYITSKKIKKPLKKIVSNGAQIYGYVVSLSGNGSAFVLPFIIKREEKLGMDLQKSKLVTATAFNMPGSLISDIVFIIGVMSMTGFTMPFLTVMKLMFSLMIITIIAPAIPMGPGSIVAGVLPSYGFNESMIQLYTTMYYKQGTSNSATNNAADLYITPFV